MFGQYAAFIIPSYVVTALVIVGLTIWIRFQYRSNLRAIEQLEQSGHGRRSKQST